MILTSVVTDQCSLNVVTLTNAVTVTSVVTLTSVVIRWPNGIVIFLDFHSTKQGQPLADSWSRGLD